MAPKHPEPAALLAFARSFVDEVDVAEYINETELADRLRSYAGLPPFPVEASLRRALDYLGIAVRFLPFGSTLEAMNTWAAGEPPTIHIARKLHGSRLEQMLCHELREILENSFKRVSADYRGRDTRDNTAMHRVSQRFAGALLLEENATRLFMRELDFDLQEFSKLSGRSLPSSLVRLSEVFPKGGKDYPRVAFWLLETPFELVRAKASTLSDFAVKYWGYANGFSTSAGGPLAAYARKGMLPIGSKSLQDFERLTYALSVGEPFRLDYVGFEPELVNCTLVAERIDSQGSPFRVLVAAIARDDLPMLNGWLQRLDIHARYVWKNGKPGPLPVVGSRI